MGVRWAPTYGGVVDVVAAARSAGVVVIGAGQAGLAVSHQLAAVGVEHIVLERDRVAQSWRGRWDSFTLVTPTSTIRLPGHTAEGAPEGYLAKADIVALLEQYASANQAPVFEGVDVERLDAGPRSGFVLRTSAGELPARAVVVCSGAFQKPHRPTIAAGLPVRVPVLDATDYRNPDDIGPGRVVIVGSGQTGCQLAEELHLAGREVVLACGRAPWIPRRLEGRDTFTWLCETSFFDQPLAALPSPAARLVSNPQATGRDGGHDLHYRTLQELGVQLTGRLAYADDSAMTFADDLDASVSFGDARYHDLKTLLATQLPAKGIIAPEMPDPPPFHADPIASVATKDVAAVIFTSGFRPDYARWVGLPVFDELGFPITVDGAAAVGGLYFCGVHFLRNRQSGLLMGVGADAALVADSVARYVRR